MSDQQAPHQTSPRVTAARVHRWFDANALVPRYGVQVRVGGKWLHVAVGGEVALDDTEAQAQASADEIMRQVTT